MSSRDMSCPGIPWLFSPLVDLLAFAGSAAASLAILAWGDQAGLLESGETPEWAWFSLILLVDVAHVYATGFRVYLDRDELSRRPLLYTATPMACFFASAVIYSESVIGFWRCMAYLAVFHFVRQQYGWVMLYRGKGGETSAWSKRIDAAAIYMATLYPLVYWHAALPRRFSWFVAHDFFSLPPWTERVAWLLYLVAFSAYAIKACWVSILGRPNPGKDIVVGTTAACWYIGIVAYNSDFAFTVTNVVIHGVPYLVLIWWYMLGSQSESARIVGPMTKWRAAVMLISTVWLLAYMEELLWNRAVWHEHGWLFGPPIDDQSWQAWVVPALAVPQLTHYILDGFIWKRRNNPSVSAIVDSPLGE